MRIRIVTEGASSNTSKRKTPAPVSQGGRS
jgi:hypothetical protein